MTLPDRLDEIAGKLLTTKDYSTFAHAIYQAAIELRSQPDEAPIMDRIYQRLALLAFMPTEVSQEEAKRLGYPYVKLNDVETAIREELGK